MGMDKAEAIKRIKDHIRVHHIGEYPHIKISEALSMAISALATDTNVGDKVEVVRCKDCKNYDSCELTCELLFNPCATNAAWYPDDFCSYGERKDNG